ncbi:glucans biosynthesis glucosyltransferase H [Klebsiella pneumoniae]|uniref:Glucans biosynthesis glucosyltransferase H n=1 Tax=Klebsiella pneumoniae TaxID=573 RepID=A0A377UYK7_KLEPN|nr:glucans biosynthesis glucosyltransferase H [Klebsiella pneumoniae]
MKPFIEHCALAPLPGEGNFAGSILSHDFVEAALMRRAGWGGVDCLRSAGLL